VTAHPADSTTAPSTAGQFGLLGERRFGPFFLTQFLGALNDNVFKQSLLALATFQAAALSTLSTGVMVNLASGLFILPFFLFSATAGQLADKYEKTRLIRAIKLFEIAIMVVGAIGFITRNLTLLLAALFLMGTHSAFFGPVKYAILPQSLRKDEIVGGNALVESGTFLAILIGTVLGGIAGAASDGATLWVPVATIGIAVAGYFAARTIPASPAADPGLRVNWNLATETWRNLKFTAQNKVVFKSILGISWFWFFGAFFISQLPIFARDYLGGAEGLNIALLIAFSFGIGIGSLLCERLSGHKVEIGLVPFGSIGLTVFAVDLYFASPAAALVAGAQPVVTIGAYLASLGNWRVLVDLFMIGIFGGFFIVPLYALVQTRSEPAHQSRVIAGNNVMNALFMVVAAGIAAGLLSLGATIPQLFLFAAITNAAVALYIYKQVPEFLMRFLAWLLIHSVYRLDKSGLAHIPERGPALIVCNHISFVDAVVIMAACPRPIRFVMDHQIFKTPVLAFIFRESRAIPIAPAKVDPQTLERAYDEVAKALDAGDIVGIFPEGRISDTGDLYPFRGGVRRILDRTPVPVIPMALRGLWGSFFSRVEGRAMSKPFRRGLFSKISLVVDSPWAPERVTPEGLQEHVRAMRGDWR
jgi:1-acyl-sn-glycerol-3-phosphate acyltransferase